MINILILFVLSLSFVGKLLCVEPKLQQQVRNQEMVKESDRLSDDELKQLETELDAFRLKAHLFRMDRESTNKAQEHLEILKQHDYLSHEIWEDYEGTIWFANWVILPDGSVCEPAMVTFEWERLAQFAESSTHTRNEILRARKDINLCKALAVSWDQDTATLDEYEKVITHAEQALQYNTVVHNIQ